MENYQETLRWIKDARDCCERADRCLSERDWRGTVQNAQLTIELSVKSVIAFFEEPVWTHRPDRQLKMIIDKNKEEIGKKFGQQMMEALLLLVDDTRIAAPWHGWSTYGKPREDGTGWAAAVDLCTREIAEDLMKRAQRAFTVAEKFLSGL